MEVAADKPSYTILGREQHALHIIARLHRYVTTPWRDEENDPDGQVGNAKVAVGNCPREGKEEWRRTKWRERRRKKVNPIRTKPGNAEL